MERKGKKDKKNSIYVYENDGWSVLIFLYYD